MNLTPPSASADNEELRELQEFVADISAFFVDPVYEGSSAEEITKFLVNRTAEYAMYQKSVIALHTKEAERRARIDEHRIAFTWLYGLINDLKKQDMAMQWHKETEAELAAPVIPKTDMEVK